MVGNSEKNVNPISPLRGLPREEMNEIEICNSTYEEASKKLEGNLHYLYLILICFLVSFLFEVTRTFNRTATVVTILPPQSVIVSGVSNNFNTDLKMISSSPNENESVLSTAVSVNIDQRSEMSPTKKKFVAIGRNARIVLTAVGVEIIGALALKFFLPSAPLASILTAIFSTRKFRLVGRLKQFLLYLPKLAKFEKKVKKITMTLKTVQKGLKSIYSQQHKGKQGEDDNKTNSTSWYYSFVENFLV